MAKYECTNCKYRPCFINQPKGLIPALTCPYLSRAAKWRKTPTADKPDPKPSVPVDGIVNLARIITETQYDDDPDRDKFMAFARAIEAKIEKTGETILATLRGEVANLRKLHRDNEEVLNSHATRIRDIWSDLTAAGIVQKQPQPCAPAQDDGIVKQIRAAIHCHDNKLSPFTSERAILQFLERWGVTIEAKIASENQARKEEIGKLKREFKDLLDWTGDLNKENRALRKLFRNHESRIKELDTSTPERTSLLDLVHISSKENLEAACKIEDLEGKVEELEKRLKGKKVVELLRAEQPQQDGAVAKDEKGEEHELIPRRSVVETPNIEMLFLYKNRYGNFVGYTSKQPQAEYKKPRRSENGTWVALPGHVTWVFDLPSCGDEGTIPRGDK